MAIRILILSAAIALSACVSDQQRDRLVDMMMYQNATRQPAMFYAMPPIASGGRSLRLQTTCSRLGAYTYCN